jgi:hypothetical protein
MALATVVLPVEGSADEDDVTVLVDEAAGEELLDDLGGELRARSAAPCVTCR